MSYENVYDVGLLDDLHNYFPNILYRPDQFQNVQDVLMYIREMTQRRFNLFDYGRRRYQETSAPAAPAARMSPWAPMAPAASAAPAAPPAIPRVRLEEPEYILRTFINLPLRLDRAVGINSLFQDVVVNASSEIIEAASTQITLEEDAENDCPICQDHMRQGELIRKLNVCNHEFHKSCVDNWFLNESVLCPTCRHDIRESSRESNESQGPETPLPPLAQEQEQGFTTPPRGQTAAQAPQAPQAPQVPQVPQAPSRNSLRDRSTEVNDLITRIFNTHY